MDKIDIIQELNQRLHSSEKLIPEEIPVNILVKGLTANYVYLISQFMSASNPDITDEDVHGYIFWNGVDKILKDLAKNVQNDNPES